jgi:hypothetical protein
VGKCQRLRNEKRQSILYHFIVILRLFNSYAIREICTSMCDF